MQLILRLGTLLGQGSDVPRGLIQEIARQTDLERHSVSSLVRGEAKYVSLEALGRICEAIAQRRSIDARALAAELFAFLPDELWKMLAECELLQFCLGKRHVPNWPGKDYVTASDSYLQGLILSQISHPSLRRAVDGAAAHHFPPPYLLPSAGERQLGKQVELKPKFVAAARQLLSSCRERSASGLIAIGSTKICLLVEVLCAEWFNAVAGVPQAGLDHPKQRSVPLFFCYREDDVQPQSCCGGTQLTKRRRRDEPGIHYEGEDGKWEFCVCDGESRDAAFLMYTYRPLVKQVELACGGFSGDATTALASGLNRIVTGVKPQYITPELHMGIYVIELRYQQAKRGPAAQNGIEDFDFVLHPVAPAAIERRLASAGSPSPSRAAADSAPSPVVRRPQARPK